MEILIDTSIFGRLVNRVDPLRPQVKSCLDELSEIGELVITPQVLTEFTSVASRPTGAPNGLGLSPEQVIQQIDEFLGTFLLRKPGIDEFEHFRSLYSQIRPLGKSVHDLRHVAAMKSLGIKHILTLNPRHFRDAQAHGHITVLTPEEILRTPP